MKMLSIISLILFLFSPTLTGQSDPKAIEIAENVMSAIGGQKNWDNTRFIQWNFFGRRMWYWDKATGDVRCELKDKGVRIVMNINNMSGTVYAHDIVQTNKDSLDKYLSFGYRMWVNDSYWLVMPFKLQDPGTTIKYLGLKANAEDVQCDVLELAFSEVGVTPDNKYWIYVDPSSSLIVQWDYYKNYTDSESSMSTPWAGYNKYGKILLSDGRGKGRLSDIDVHKKMPHALFSNVGITSATILESY